MLRAFPKFTRLDVEDMERIRTFITTAIKTLSAVSKAKIPADETFIGFSDAFNNEESSVGRLPGAIERPQDSFDEIHKKIDSKDSQLKAEAAKILYSGVGVQVWESLLAVVEA